ncbi:MAG: hypothetical protein JWR52_1507 [Marmoricola sp.]|nr:hypothetical protein [Marmoricola sp.]
MTLERRLAAEVSAGLDGWVDAVVSRVAAEVPDLVGDDTAAELATSSSRALLSEFAAALTQGDVATAYRAPIAALGFARHLARSSVPLAGLLRSYRLGQELLFERAAQLAEPGELDGLHRVGLLTFRFVDAVVGEVTEAFEREREASLRGSLARRERLVSRLLDGAEVPLAEIERVLGQRMSGRHLALIAWSPDEPDGETLATRLRGVWESFGPDAPLVIPGAAGDVFAWVVPGGADEPTLSLPSGVRLAIGEAGTGLAGFIGSRRQADAARRTARYVESAVVRYRDIRLLHLLVHDHPAALAFAAEELGDLAADEHGDLRRTLWVYLDSGRDSTATAARLAIHRNTVMRRLARAGELLGAPTEDRTAELLVALLVLGAAMPTPETS